MNTRQQLHIHVHLCTCTTIFDYHSTCIVPDQKYTCTVCTPNSRAVRPLPLPSEVKCHHYITIVDQPFPDAVPARYSYLKVIGRRLSDGKIAIKDQICVLPTIAEVHVHVHIHVCLS